MAKVSFRMASASRGVGIRRTDQHGARKSAYEVSDHHRTAVPAAHPRTGSKDGMTAAFSAGIRHKPETAFGMMLADILEETVPGHSRPNFCDLIRGSRFAE